MKKKKQSYFKDSLSLIKSNPWPSLKIVLFDILFVLSISLLYFVISFIISFNFDPFNISNQMVVTYLVVFLIYYLILFFLYTFFKFIDLNIIKSLLKKSSSDYERLIKFYYLNLGICFSMFITFLVLNIVFLIGSRQEYAPYIFMIINIPLFLIFYTFMNVSHSIFSGSKDVNLTKIILKTFNFIKQPKKYIGIYINNAFVITFYFIFFYLIGLILKATVFQDIVASYNYFVWYSTFFVILTTIFFYLIIYFNRIYFYIIIKDLKK